MSPDSRYGLISLGWFAVALGAPWLVARGTAAFARRGGRAAEWFRVGGAIATLLVAVTISPLAFVLGVCAGPPPGESTAAQRLKRETVPLIAALERHRAARGTYPARLDLLTPDFIAPAAVHPEPADPGYPLTYTPDDTAGYVLEFRYTGPGMNHCSYRPRDAAWRCGGYL